MPVPVIPSPRTWSLNEQIKVPYLRADVSAAVQLLAAPPSFWGSAQATGQLVPSGVMANVSLDTENWDSVNGHNDAFGAYYCQVPGYYLAEGAVPLSGGGSTGLMSALIGFSSAGGAVTWYGGGLIPTSATAGQDAMPTVAKLLKLVNTGAIGSGSADSVQLGCFQTAGVSASLAQTGGTFPSCWVTWVGALSGTAPLAVPANPAWAVPPSVVTSAFMNANVRDTIRFLIYPPVMEATYAAGTATLTSQATLPAVGTTIPLDTATYDTYSAFSTGSSTWTAPVAGIYYAYGQMCMHSSSTSLTFAAGLTVTSSNYNGGTTVTLWENPRSAAAVSASAVATVRRRLRLNAGDTIALAGFQHDSSNLAPTLLSNQWASRLITVWRGA